MEEYLLDFQYIHCNVKEEGDRSLFRWRGLSIRFLHKRFVVLFEIFWNFFNFFHRFSWNKRWKRWNKGRFDNFLSFVGYLRFHDLRDEFRPDFVPKGYLVVIYKKAILVWLVDSGNKFSHGFTYTFKVFDLVSFITIDRFIWNVFLYSKKQFLDVKYICVIRWECGQTWTRVRVKYYNY